MSVEPFRLLTPDGRWAIEVTEKEGEGFTARVILDGKMEIDTFTSDDSRKIILWATKQMREVMRRNRAD